MTGTSSTSGALIDAAVLTGAETVELQQRPYPVPAPGEALVRIAYTGICGSDFPIVAGTHPRVTLPLVMGHEITGVVVDAGSGDIAAGTRVAVHPLLACGECGACTQGLLHVCRALRLRGIDVDGSMTEVMAVPIASLAPFAPHVDPQAAALAEPLAVAVHAVHRSGLVAGEHVLVFGAGPIGMLVALVARHSGAAQITLVEPSADRRAGAASLGFAVLAPDEVLTARERGDDRAAPLVFDCAGHHSVSGVITQVAPVRARIVVVAVHKGATEFDLREVAFAEQTVIGIRVYERADFDEAVALIDSGALPLTDLPISVYPLDRVQDAFAEAKSPLGAVKVLIAGGARSHDQ